MFVRKLVTKSLIPQFNLQSVERVSFAEFCHGSVWIFCWMNQSRAVKLGYPSTSSCFLERFGWYIFFLDLSETILDNFTKTLLTCHVMF